jgi:hypothetical protein
MDCNVTSASEAIGSYREMSANSSGSTNGTASIGSGLVSINADTNNSGLFTIRWDGGQTCGDENRLGNSDCRSFDQFSAVNFSVVLS